jgi:hypothetical protein
MPVSGSGIRESGSKTLVKANQQSVAVVTFTARICSQASAAQTPSFSLRKNLKYLWVKQPKLTFFSYIDTLTEIL